MQGSSETVEESLLFEVAGTVAELLLADALLKSRTPISDVLQGLKYIFPSKQQSDKVSPDDAQIPKRLTRRSLRGVNSWQRFFCETVMISITITEAAALLISSLFWLLMDSNPNEPGSPKIPISQTIFNLAVMLFGELVVTDGIVAYVSNKFEDRYVVDIASAWIDLRTNKRALVRCLVFIMALYSSNIILILPRSLCYTSPLQDEANWALTSCPASPTNITEMVRVSAEYQMEWEKYN
jgi:hypothetical protein